MQKCSLLRPNGSQSRSRCKPHNARYLDRPYFTALAAVVPASQAMLVEFMLLLLLLLLLLLSAAVVAAETDADGPAQAR